MKRFYTLVLIVLVAPLLLGMGSMHGDSPSGRIPLPTENYSATCIDQADVVTVCSKVSIEGKTVVSGKRGEGVYTIPFENIDSILFFIKGEKLTGNVRLKDKSTVDLILNKDVNVYGKTKYGTFQIELKKMKKLIIKGLAGS